MRLLAIETSTAQGGAAILENGRILSSRQWMRSQSHSELLTAAIEDILREAKFPIDRIDSLAVGIGPGSFTGIRVAISAVKALAFARGLPIYSYDSTEIIEAGRPQTAPSMPSLIAINAQKNQFFTTCFAQAKELLPPRTQPLALSDPAALKIPDGVALLMGDGAEELQRLNPVFKSLTRPKPEYDFPKAEILAELAWSERSKRKALVWKDVQPLYMRTSGAEEKLRGSNVKTREST